MMMMNAICPSSIATCDSTYCGQWDGGRLINDQQLSLGQLGVVLRQDVLNSLHKCEAQ
jgi:hypothetical protein